MNTLINNTHNISTIHLDKGPEWALLELICLHTIQPANITIEDVLDNHSIDWGALLEHAIMHKMLPRVSAILAQQYYIPEINTAYKHIPNFIGGHFKQSHLVNQHKINVFRLAAQPIITAFKKADVKLIATKGFIFENTIYQPAGSRNFDTDIDFMILPEDMKAAKAIMASLDIPQGFFDQQTLTIKPHHRKDQITYQLSPDHLAPYVVVTDDPVFKFVYIDIACSFTWINSPYQVPMHEALLNPDPITLQSSGCVLDTLKLDTTHEFIFTVLHLFREAWLDRWVNIKQDVNLMKFTDVMLLFKANKSVFCDDRFINTLKSYALLQPILWVLEHTDRTFDTDIVSSLGLTGLLDNEFLFSAHDAGAPEQQCMKPWFGSMRDRLHTKDNRSCFKNPEALVIT